MFKYWIIILSFLLCSAAFAGKNDKYVITTDLTESQQAEIAMQVAKMKETAATQAAQAVQAVSQVAAAIPDISNAKKVSEWVAVGADVGKGLAGAAKELGIAVNEFSESKVGKLTMFLIIWKMVGVQLLPIIFHGIGAILLFSVLFPTWYYMYRRFCYKYVVEEKFEPTTSKRISRLVTIDKRERVDGDHIAAFMAALAVICAICLIIGFSY